MTPETPPAGPPARILIVDDDGDMRALLAHMLSADAGLEIEQAKDAAEARARLLQRAFDLVITDLSMPGEGGTSLMEWAREHRPGPGWIVLTGHGTLDAAVRALQLGAYDFLTKPIRAPESLRTAARNAILHRRLVAERDRLHAQLRVSHERLREHVGQLEQACQLLEEQAEGLRADLHRAGIIQQALLPRVPPRLAAFHVRALYRPSQSVGGDLYDVIRLDERHVALLVADAAGHGLAAAMLAVLFRSQLPLVDPETRWPHEPRDVLRSANRALCETLPAPGLFLTAAYCLLDTALGEATIASAGHPPLFWLRGGEQPERIFHTGPALGLDPGADFAQQSIPLLRGDALLLYSDGLYEHLGADPGAPSEAIARTLGRAGEAGLAAVWRLLAAPSEPGPAEVPAGDDVTALLLVAAPGVSTLDNGRPPALAAPEPPRASDVTLVGSDARHKVLSVQGRGDWTRSAAFHAECLGAIRAGRDVMLDLTLCRELDSTFLGTVHQLCEAADGADVEFRLQGVCPGVERLFEELGMENVLDHVVPCMLPLPTRMESLEPADAGPQASAQLLLRAHQSLAGLNERNRREFDPLLAQLRGEVGALLPFR